MNTKTFPPPLPPVEEASRSCTALFAAGDPAAPGPSAHRALRAEPPRRRNQLDHPPGSRRAQRGAGNRAPTWISRWYCFAEKSARCPM